MSGLNKTIAIIMLFASCKSSDEKVLQVRELPHYPSASAIEYSGGNFYIMGDDSPAMLVLNSDLEPVDSISFFPRMEKRVPKPIKADLEAMTVVKDKRLLILGSGSLPPFRNGGWLMDLETKQKDSIRLDTLYNRLTAAGLKVLNIEGAASIPHGILLANRGNYAWRKNHLILLTNTFWKTGRDSVMSMISLGGNDQPGVFNGVSGLTYAPAGDRLLLTVSTELTSSSTADGAIGKSYLWIIDNISSKRNWKAINPNRIIDLEELDIKFAGQKIESVCLVKENRKMMELVLTADNDDGGSTLFKVIVKKN